MKRDPAAGVSRRAFLAGTGAAGALALAGCVENVDAGDGAGDGGGGGAIGRGDGLSGEVVVTGSSTVFPVTDTIAEQFMEEHPRVNVTVDSTGSGGGFENHFCPGNSDINGASRPITDGEIEKCATNGVEPVEFQIASDALTVAVNNDADWVDCMTFDELSRIWRADGLDRWSDVREEWPDEPFQLFGPAETSGTYDWFDANVVGEETPHTADHQPTEEDNIIVKGIQDNDYGMGYFGYAYYSSNSDLVKAISIEREAGEGCTPPSLENAKDGSYPMARPLFIYPAKSAIQRPEVAEFLEFYFKKAESDLVADIGYVPESTTQLGENISKLTELRDA